eukprot:scaffold6188_cov99-Isochrysis_galbana.AAC.2
MAEGAATSLHTHGCATVPVMGDQERREWYTRLASDLAAMPEYLHDKMADPPQYVLGGFGGLGNPASFHNDAVRALRLRLFDGVLQPVLQEYARLQGLGDSVRAEMLFNRVGSRHKSFGAVSKEAWHRDIYAATKYGLRELPQTLRSGSADDVILGGWLNLSDQPQRFVGILGSQDEAAVASGFGVLTAAQAAEARAEARLAAQASRRIGQCLCDPDGAILIPAGHLVIFPQRLLHSVHGGTPRGLPQLRLSIGVRLTEERVPLFPETAEWARANAVPRLPSGQLPPMYSQNHYQFFNSRTTSRYREWGAVFKPQCVFRRQTTDGAEYCTPGSVDDAAPACNKRRCMPSLREMGLPLYQYSARDMALMSPQPLRQ